MLDPAVPQVEDAYLPDIVVGGGGVGGGGPPAVGRQGDAPEAEGETG